MVPARIHWFGSPQRVKQWLDLAIPEAFYGRDDICRLILRNSTFGQGLELGDKVSPIRRVIGFTPWQRYQGVEASPDCIDEDSRRQSSRKIRIHFFHSTDRHPLGQVDGLRMMKVIGGEGR